MKRSAMKVRTATPVLTYSLIVAGLLGSSAPAFAATAALETLPEEVIITGDSSLLNLRMQMLEAEKRAYDVFNRFNDEARFEISCGITQPTGTRFRQQVCAPEFQNQANAMHARGALESYKKTWEGYVGGITNFLPPDTLPSPYIPMEAVIAAQQGDYKRKLRQVAEEHPEFLDALIEYSQLREQHEAATATRAERD